MTYLSHFLIKIKLSKLIKLNTVQLNKGLTYFTILAKMSSRSTSLLRSVKLISILSV